MRDIYSIRGIVGCCHLLVDGDGCVMVDAGLAGERFQILRILKRLGLSIESIKAVLVTHGHADHTGNLRWLKEAARAKVYAHALERQHIAGRHVYQGSVKWCGRLESVARALTRYRPVAIDVEIADGDVLPFWGGLRVVHLPGHTAGHSGFYSEARNMLFCGDLFASYSFSVHWPPSFFNTEQGLLAESAARVRELNPKGVLPSHYDFFDAELHRRRFDRLCGKR